MITLFVIRCTKCGREQEWKTGSQVGRMDIEMSGSVVICACGHGVAEDAGHGALREFNVPQCIVGREKGSGESNG